MLKHNDMPVVSSNRSGIFILLHLVAALVLLSGCGSYKDIRVESCRIDSITPAGFKAVDAGLSLSVYNPVREITLSDIRGKVYYKDAEIGVFEAPDVVIPGKDTSEVNADIRASLSGHTGLVGIMSMVGNARPEDFSMDIALVVKVKGGLKKKIFLERVPVENFLHELM